MEVLLLTGGRKISQVPTIGFEPLTEASESPRVGSRGTSMKFCCKLWYLSVGVSSAKIPHLTLGNADVEGAHVQVLSSSIGQSGAGWRDLRTMINSGSSG